MASAVPGAASRRVSLPALELEGTRPSTDRIKAQALPMRRSRSLQRFNSVATHAAIPRRRVGKESTPSVMESDAPADEEEEPTPRASRATSDRSPEEERFERMMERFQLRRMSISSGTPNSGPRIGSRRNSMDHTVLATTARRGSLLRSLAPESVVESPTEKDPPSTRAEMVLVSKFREKADAAMEITYWIQDLVSSTFEAASVATGLRLGLLMVVFVGKLLYTPFAIAYDDDESWANVLDAMVDCIFFLNILATCNTETTNAQRHPITTRRAIWRYYRRNGFFTDLLAALPFEHLLMIVPHTGAIHWIVGVLKLALQNVSMTRHLRIFHAAWSKEVMASDTSAVAWMMFSRYSHLVRIMRIIVFIVIVAHYFACMWSWLHVGIDPDFFVPNDLVTIHMNSFYVALQLLQGQGVETKTPAQALFGSVAVLLGSIALAVMFGNVAILVANCSASSTAYQRRRERVFAIMGKLELPHPIRERVHQYYEYLHAEYELLDGEIVKFAKDLSHTLTLETLLFRFMDVLVNVPHWHGCSPDFQKQLVLSLSVRIYLPDDFIMRRGEVGAECYLINRGTCKLCEYPTGNYEPPTPPMLREYMLNATRRQRRSSAARLNLQLPFQGQDGAQSEAEGLENGPYSRIRELTRGQAIGDFALLANYERSSDLRAVAYVEMCVIERESFQRILTRYPADRKVVVTSIVRHNMLNRETQKAPCPLMAAVQRVKPDVAVEDAIMYMSRALNPAESDPSIVFGVSEKLARRVRNTVQKVKEESSISARSEGEQPAEFAEAAQAFQAVQACQPTQCSQPEEPTTKPLAGPHVEEIMSVIREIQERLTRLERPSRLFPLDGSGDRTGRATPRRSNNPTVNITPRRGRRRHTAITVRVRAQPELRKVFSAMAATQDAVAALKQSSTTVAALPGGPMLVGY